MGTILMCVVPKWDLWIITSANIYISTFTVSIGIEKKSTPPDLILVIQLIIFKLQTTDLNYEESSANDRQQISTVKNHLQTTRQHIRILTVKVLHT
jgi:hypothetical protein